MEQIKVKISADGSIEYDVQGIKGKSCKDVTKFIDSLSTVTESKNTAEYCEIPAIEQDRLKSRS